MLNEKEFKSQLYRWYKFVQTATNEELDELH